jgi:tetratricopeptide (TPR) repeat protein
MTWTGAPPRDFIAAMRLCLWATVACLLGTSTIDGSAAARPARAQAKAVAKKHDAKARSLFHLGRFEEAAQEYEKAYVAVPLPEFLHNLARCHQRLEGAHHSERALFYFDSYLKAAPDAPNRAAIEAVMAKIRARLRQLKATPTPAPPKTTTPPTALKPTPKTTPAAIPAPGLAPAPVVPKPEPAVQAPAPQPDPEPRVSQSTPVYKRWWFWTIIGVVAAGATTAAVVATRPGEAAPLMGSMPPGQVQLELRGRR